MLSWGARRGQGGNQIGHASRVTPTHILTAEEAEERRRRISDAARMRGSYRYARPSTAFARQESHYWQACTPTASASPSSSSPASSSLSLPLPVPSFASGDYVEDDDIDRIAVLLPAAIRAGEDFVDDRDLATVERLVRDTTCRDADKAEEWRREAEEQGRIFVDLDPEE